MICEYLKTLKEQSGLTVSQWSDLAKVPADTINKILQGVTKSPTLDTVAALVVAAGGSMDEFLGIKKDAQEQGEEVDDVKIFEALRDAYESKMADLKAMHERTVEELKASHELHLKSKDVHIRDMRTSRNLYAALTAALVAFLVVVIVIDLTNGGIGYVRY